MKNKISYYICIISLISLIILSFLWEWKISPIRNGGSWLTLKALILCLPLSGILKGKLYVYQISNIFILLYFTEGIVRVISDRNYTSKMLALGEIILSLIFIINCILYIKSKSSKN